MNRKFQTGTRVEIAFLGGGETKVELICNKDIQDISMGQSISWGFEVDSYDEISVCRISCEVIIAGSSLINEPSNNLSWIVIPIKDLKRLLGAYSQGPIREAYIHKNQITVFGNKLIGT